MVKPKSTSTSKSRASKKHPVKAKTGTKKATPRTVKAPTPAKKAAGARKPEKPTKRASTAKPAKNAAARTPLAKTAPARKAAPAKAPVAKPGRGKGADGKGAATKTTKAAKPPASKAAAKPETAAGPAVAAAAPSEAAPPSRLALLKRAPARKAGSVICPLSGWEVMPAKPSLSERTLKRLRARLIEERDQQLRQAEELAAEAEELAQERDPGDTQFDEESGEGDTVNVERERDLLLSATARGIVEAIERALARMDAGTYGVCVPAGRKLSLERLEAIPYAEECVDCKARAERRR
jgi:RNA polymerase-binding transcription factor DksA